MFDFSIDARRDFLAMAPKHQEIDQAVFQCRAVLLDGMGGKQRVDPMQQRRQKIAHRKRAAGGQHSQEQQQPTPKSQSADHHPMVDQRGGQQINQGADPEGQQRVGDIDAFDLAPRVAQTLIDKGFRPRLDDGSGIAFRSHIRGCWTARHGNFLHSNASLSIIDAKGVSGVPNSRSDMKLSRNSNKYSPNPYGNLVPTLCVGTDCAAALRRNSLLRNKFRFSDAERRGMAFPRSAWEREAKTMSPCWYCIPTLWLLTAFLGFFRQFPPNSY